MDSLWTASEYVVYGLLWLFLLFWIVLPLFLLRETWRLSPKKLLRLKTWWRFSLPAMFIGVAAWGVAFGTARLMPGWSTFDRLALSGLVFVAVCFLLTLLSIFFCDAFFSRGRRRRIVENSDAPIAPPANGVEQAEDGLKRRRWWRRKWANRYRPMGMGKDHTVPPDRRDDDED